MGLIKTDGIAPNGSTGLLLYTDTAGTVQLLKLSQTGLVEIGNLTAQSSGSALRLDVAGSIPTGSLSIPSASSITTINNYSTVKIHQANSPIKLNIGSNATSSWIQSYNTSNHLATPLLLQSGGGSVGIGTASPSVALEVAGSIRPTGGIDLPVQVSGNAILVGGAGTPDSGRIIIGDGSGWKYKISKRIASATTDLVTFMDTGSVGIGVAAPTVALDVAGSIKATGAIVATGDISSSGTITPGSWVQGSCPRLYIYATAAAANADAANRPIGSLVIIGS
jgi:hypothetical protein